MRPPIASNMCTSQTIHEVSAAPLTSQLAGAQFPPFQLGSTARHDAPSERHRPWARERISFEQPPGQQLDVAPELHTARRPNPRPPYRGPGWFDLRANGRTLRTVPATPELAHLAAR